MKISTNFFRKKMYLLCLGITILSLSSFLSYEKDLNLAQTQIVIEITNLDPFVYADIVKETRKNDDLSIVTSCVPIKMICFEKNHSENVTQEQLFDTITSILSGLESVEEIKSTDLDKEELLEDCLEARTQR